MTRCAPASPDSRRRLVTRTALFGVPGSSGADLGGVGGVVEDEQDPAVGEPAAQHRGLGVQVVGDGRAGDAERAEQVGEHVADLARVGGAREVGEELAVGEGVADAVRHADGEHALADPGLAGQHDHGRVPLGEHGGQLVDQLAAAGEVEDLGRQLADRPRVRLSCSPRRIAACTSRSSAPGSRPVSSISVARVAR